jgi:hypothetical protein
MSSTLRRSAMVSKDNDDDISWRAASTSSATTLKRVVQTLLEPKIHLLTPAVAKSAMCLAESAAEEELVGNFGSRVRRSRT